MAQITVYSTDPCSFCSRAKELLQRRGYAYEEINLSKDPAGRAELVDRTGMFSFPQIVINGEVLGGFRELVQADMSGRLEGGRSDPSGYLNTRTSGSSTIRRPEANNGVWKAMSKSSGMTWTPKDRTNAMSGVKRLGVVFEMRLISSLRFIW